MSEADVEAFIERWRPSGGSERANYQLFLTELCELLGIGKPGVATSEAKGDPYCFERPVMLRKGDGSTSTGFIDLYKKDCFVCEAKQGSDQKPKGYSGQEAALGLVTAQPIRTGTAIRGTRGWAKAMTKAKNQADGYARALHDEGEGWPPFLIITDVGYSIELWADFTRSGRSYQQFPNAARFRIELEHLRDKETRDLLVDVWTDPLSLDPAARSAKVTREIASRLAVVAKLLEDPVEKGGGGLAPHTVASFLMRCLFTMFAEDVGLLPKDVFRDLLKTHRDNPAALGGLIAELWGRMNGGGFSAAIARDVKRFNGGLFKETAVPNLATPWIDQLVLAAEADWRDVEPAIFGTLLERALDEKERHKLGAHYTPRAYVERLVIPTVIQPLREDWEASKVLALKHAEEGRTQDAIKVVLDYHRDLCAVRVLDPACGTGNFLYVTLELMKRLEGEVLDLLQTLGADQYILELDRHTVDPHQFLGLELNERAVAIAELVVWIGFLQWHIRTRGRVDVPEPILRDFRNIVGGDAILAYDERTLRRDGSGKPVTIWDGETTKPHPVTGDEVPDDTARRELYDYTNPKPAPAWPKADFIVGNPPFLGGKDIRDKLGEGYAQALWNAYPKLPNSIDLVMYWWDRAARLVRAGECRRFGLITTKSITQTFSGRVVEMHLSDKKPLSLVFAIPNHPWFKATDRKAVRDAAAVRIAMSVGEAGDRPGRAGTVTNEAAGDSDSAEVALRWAVGKITPALKVGPDVRKAQPLAANGDVASPGVKLHGAGFIVTPDQARKLGLGSVPGLEQHILRYRNGRDLTGHSRGAMVIDMFGLSEAQVRERFPVVYQWISDRVKGVKEAKIGSSKDVDIIANRWWLFGRTRPEMRRFLVGVSRYIVTVETAKHRVFQFLDVDVRPDNKLLAIGLEDACWLSVLSSRTHMAWALEAGGRLGFGNDPVYVKSSCFDKFPFPELTEAQRARLADLGERLDAHRKTQLAAHPDLTLTGLYNVLEKVRAGEPLTDADREVYDDGLVGTLKQYHDEIDAAVFDAYGWPQDLSDEEIVARVLALNLERAAEEAKGRIRWLRPAFQDPNYGKTVEPARTQAVIEGLAPAAAAVAHRLPWPKTEIERIKALRRLLGDADAPLDVDQAAAHFVRARRKDVEALLRVLVDLGAAERIGTGYSATVVEKAA